MTTHSSSQPSPPPPLLAPPEWVLELLGVELSQYAGEGTGRPGPQLFSRERGDVTLVSGRLPNARAMTRPDFEGGVTQLYREIFRSLAGRPSSHPVRFWNHIPGLHDSMGPGMDRYMAFNAGRFRAMVAQYGNADAVRRVLPTASGVGHTGQDLVIHCLAAASPGRPIENPRQVPAYLYSKRFGPIPPCFSRASIATINGTAVMLIAGTASIRGEESVHIGDLNGQVRETFLNLGTVIERASEAAVIGAAEVQSGAPKAASLETARRPTLKDVSPDLARMTQVRIYHPRPLDEVTIRDAAGPAFPKARSVEVLRADLCRTELLVEVEGIASLEDGGHVA